MHRYDLGAERRMYNCYSPWPYATLPIWRGKCQRTIGGWAAAAWITQRTLGCPHHARYRSWPEYTRKQFYCLTVHPPRQDILLLASLHDCFKTTKLGTGRIKFTGMESILNLTYNIVWPIGSVLLPSKLTCLFWKCPLFCLQFIILVAHLL